MILKEKILFSKEECNSIIWNTTNKTTNWSNTDRKYNSQSIEFNKNMGWLFDTLKFFFEAETGLKIIKLKKIIHFHKFIEGDWFDKHTDVKDNRLFAVGVLLNDDFVGGDFKLYNPDEYVLNKQAGNVYIFDVRIKHEITPILNNVRYSLLWFLENTNIKFKTNQLI